MSVEGLRDGTRLQVRSGNPTPEEVAALLLALDAAARADAPVERRAPAWLRAARREGLGLGPIASPGDLR